METHNRGISAPVVKEFQIEGTWAPLLVYEDGGIYLRKKEPTTLVQTLVSGSISSAETRNNSSNNKPLWEIQNNGRNNDCRSVGGSENGRRGLEEYCLPRWSSQGRRSTTVTLGSTSGQCRSSSSSTSSSFPRFSSTGSVLDNNNVSFVSWDSQSDARGLDRSFTFARQDTVQEANLGVSGGKMRSGSVHNQNGSLSHVNSPAGQMHANANGNVSTFAPPTPNLRFNSKETMEHNHVRGKLGEQSGIDLNMTPQKKTPRRKRYTPKVVREDKPKPKPTPKPNTPKPMDTKETTPRVRRTYVRMKKTSPPSTSTPPPTERTEATIDPKSTETEQPLVKSCRKSLDFDLNEQGTPKPNTPMPMVDSKESPRRIERQYVRKKRMNPPPTAPCDPELEDPVKSCRKSLNFDLNEQATGPTSPHVPDSGSTDGNLQFVTKLEVSSNGDGSPENVVVVADDRRTTLLGKRASFLGFPDALFPEICKKKRSEKPQKRSRASIITTPSIRFDNGASKYHYFNRMDVLNTWANIPRFKRRKRSKGVTRVRDLSNLKGISSVLHRKVKLSDNKSFANRGPTKRTSSGSYDANRANKKWDMVVYDFNSRSIIRRKRGPQSSSRKMMHGENNPASEEWKMGVFLEAITELMRLLDINKEGNYNVSCLERTSLVPYNINNNKQGEDSSLVLYRKEGGALVPFEGLFEPIRKRRQRARVELDDETSRVWRLLLENIDNQGIDGTDEEKVKWWENERSVFRGRVDSFIARMRLVQGDRRFTPWKGSVLDSVIGVFLTQNVSDHLSSSAFMELAARFPLKKSDHSESTLSEEATSPLVVEPEVCIPEPEESITCNDEKEGININEEPVRSGSGSVIDYYSFECIQKANNSPTTETEGASVVGDDSRAKDDATSSLQSLVSSQNSISSPNPRAPPTDPREGAKGPGLMRHYLDCPTSFMSLLKIAEGPLLREARCGISGQDHPQSTRHAGNDQQDAPPSTSKNWQSNNYVEILEAESRSSDTSRKDENSPSEQSYPTEQRGGPRSCAENKSSCYVLEGEKMVMQSQTPSSVVEEQLSSHLPNMSQQEPDVATESTATGFERTTNSVTGPTTPGKFPKRGSRGGKKNMFDWDSLRKDVEANGETRERTANTRDSIDWEAVRLADVGEIADTIKPRGMNNMLSERIKELLDRLVRDHGRVDLEWLRDIPPDKAKEYLLSFRGLGLKSVECVRLLTLHHLAFPVDTNVGRIAVRLGWVPLQPLPESLQLHLLEMYPVLESIQKYLWPRLCKLDQKTLYELHYHMITFGKVFCTKRQPNCNACPLRGECRHFASAFASARLALPGPEERSIVAPNGGIPRYPPPHPHPHVNPLPLPSIYGDNHHQEATSSTCNTNAPIIEVPSTPLPLPLPPTANQSEAKPEEVNKCEPIVEVPASPEPEPEPTLRDIEDAFYEDPDDEIPTIKLNMKEFTQTLESFMQVNRELQESGLSNALVALTPEAASIPTPKLKNISRLRTEHHVYELPDSHALLRNLDRREPDDPCSYLLAIWTPGETANSIKPPERRCAFDDPKALCNEATCSYCSSQRETNSQIVRGTLLIPCRTAMRGSFPLNGTYFQVNEVFADHDSSLKPIEVPRSWLWNLQRRTVYFGTSIPTIFRGLTTEEIQHCFWRGYVCVRGFDRKTRSPRPLMARLHFPASRMPRGARGGNKGMWMNDDD